MKKITGLFLLAGILLGAMGSSLVIAQSALTGGEYDTNQPLEITADSLEVQQDNQQAIFEGNVDVKQGEIRMRADKLIVYYADKNTAKDGGPANIKKIDAIGNVFLSSPRETAEGETGTYDVNSKRVDLRGNVVLTQGQNVLRGDKMTLNMVTGTSRVESAATTDGGTGRVKGIFVPEQKAE
ncbi:MAG: lipopolysaccharide transport periplasmic protein LptA [Sneathiella sp.]|uniref:lipopolysaccharide transport periplasmic protein LptA n=1 Tax=Sneathiella sp. TaxID=1964365 RepID=UPI0030029B10